MVASKNIGPAQALEILESSLKKRDDELESLREQLSRLRHELELTAAERDHLRSVTGRKASRQDSISKDSSDEEQTTPTIDWGLLKGESTVTPVEDPRIGQPKRMLVIGGGPAGLISLHELLNPPNRAEGKTLDGFDIQLYERRSEVGGVWYFEPENDIAKGWHHGQKGWHAAEEDQARHGGATVNGDAEKGNAANGNISNSINQSAGDMEMMDESWWKQSLANGERSSDLSEHPNAGLVDGDEETADFCYLSYPQKAPRWPSPAYEGLVGNVLPPLLEFGAHRFPKPAQGLFPSMVETHKYLMSVAAPLRPYIKTCQEVTKVVPKFHSDSDRVSWLVTKVDWSEEGQGQESTEEWDAIITAVGAFDHPYWPDTPGLTQLRKQRSPLIMHAKTYPGPRPFVNQHNKFVVVGNANSANDIAAHLAPLNSSGPLYRCIRHESNFAYLPDARIKDVPPIASIKTSNDGRTLDIELDDGMKLEGITKLIFASGYQYLFPWLQVPWVSPKDDGKPAEELPLAPASKFGAVPNLNNVTFLAAAPTLAFIGLCAGSSPMPLAEIQARTVARAWNGIYKLAPTRKELLSDYLERAEELEIQEDKPDAWRALHMVRGAPERKLTARLIDALEENEEGASEGLFRWDNWREGVAKGMRAVKEGELRRLRNARVAAGGVDGGVGGVLAYGPIVGQRFTPVFGDKTGRGKSLML